MKLFEVLLEQNILLPFLVIILLILIIIYVILLVRYKSEKNKVTDIKEMPKKKKENVIEIVDNSETGRVTKIDINEKELSDLKKDAVYIKDLLKNSIILSDEEIKNRQMKSENDNIKIIKKEVDESEIIEPKKTEAKKRSIEDIAFSKEVLPDKTINENIKIEKEQSKFEKTELIDLDEVYKMLNKRDALEKDDKKTK